MYSFFGAYDPQTHLDPEILFNNEAIPFFGSFVGSKEEKGVPGLKKTGMYKVDTDAYSGSFEKDSKDKKTERNLIKMSQMKLLEGAHEYDDMNDMDGMNDMNDMNEMNEMFESFEPIESLGQDQEKNGSRDIEVPGMSPQWEYDSEMNDELYDFYDRKDGSYDQDKKDEDDFVVFEQDFYG